MDAKEQKPESYTYAKAGVSIETGNALVRAIAPLAKSTRRAGADADLGGFGGFLTLRPQASMPHFWSPRMRVSERS
jgi:phosphoribosylformylglycinamidine cyclo-ligase